MELKAVRRRCETRLSALAVPVPFDLDRFSAAIAEQRGRPLYLHPATVDGAPCGVWISSGDADHVFFDGTTSPVHRQHIVLHELGHVVAAHEGTGSPGDWVRRLLPNLDPNVVAKVLCRTTYSDADEIEAEVFASVVLERATHVSKRAVMSTAPGSGTDDAVVQRVRLGLTEPRETR